MRYRSFRRSTSLAAIILAAGQLPAWADVPAVVTDMPVTHSLVAMVMGDLAEPVLLLERGADPHHFQLRPSQARAVEQAGLAVWMGPALTPWMERAVGALSDSATLELLTVEGLELQPYPESRLTGAAGANAHDHDHGHGHDDHGDDDHAHDDHAHGDHAHGHDDHGHAEHGHDDDHGHDDEHGHDHADGHDHGHVGHGHDHENDHAHAQADGHGHGHDDEHGHGDDHAHDDDHGHDHAHHHHAGALDPHAWMNPHNAAPWLDAIAETLAELDPANARTYRDNAVQSAQRIAALEDEIAEILAPVGDAGLVMYHDAYGYLASAFGLNILGTIALGDAADPGAARITAIRASLRDAGAVCVFPEVHHSDAYVALVSEVDDDLRVGAPLDPEGVMLEPGAGLYANLLREMATAIAGCVAGS